MDASQSIPVAVTRRTKNPKLYTLNKLKIQVFEPISDFEFGQDLVLRILKIYAVNYKEPKINSVFDSTSQVGTAEHPKPWVLGCKAVPDAHKQAWQLLCHGVSAPENLTEEGTARKHP
jgi:hypothetical protein